MGGSFYAWEKHTITGDELLKLADEDKKVL